jgi:c-di-GMP-binding flagellar brake protein YcgR
MNSSEEARITVEKRRSPRLEVYLPVDYTVSRTRSRKSGISRDIATGGIALLLKRKLPSGAQLSMSIHVPGGRGRLSVRGEVIRCQADKHSPEKGYSYRAGLRFLKIQTKATAVLSQIISLYSMSESPSPQKKKRR